MACGKNLVNDESSDLLALNNEIESTTTVTPEPTKEQTPSPTSRPTPKPTPTSIPESEE